MTRLQHPLGGASSDPASGVSHDPEADRRARCGRGSVRDLVFVNEIRSSREPATGSGKLSFAEEQTVLFRLAPTFTTKVVEMLVETWKD